MLPYWLKGKGILSFKVQLFWEDHKNVRNGSYGFEIYLVNVKTMRTIAEIFVAFSEKLNFKAKIFMEGNVLMPSTSWFLTGWWFVSGTTETLFCQKILKIMSV